MVIVVQAFSFRSLVDETGLLWGGGSRGGGGDLWRGVACRIEDRGEGEFISTAKHLTDAGPFVDEKREKKQKNELEFCGAPGTTDIRQN